MNLCFDAIDWVNDSTFLSQLPPIPLFLMPISLNSFPTSFFFHSKRCTYQYL